MKLKHLNRNKKNRSLSKITYSTTFALLALSGITKASVQVDIEDTTPLASNSYHNAISADGQIAIGNSDGHAFKYSSATGKVDLGSFGSGFSTATGISADGSIIVGSSDTASYQQRAFKYTEAGGMVNLGANGRDFSTANAISADGSTIVGSWGSSSSGYTAFKYTDSTGMTDLGTIVGNNAEASKVSADGSVIAGSLSDNTGVFKLSLFKYTDATGMVDIGTLGGSAAFITGLSANGLVIVGASGLSTGWDTHAFKHTDATGMVDLGTFGGVSSVANAVSADGSIVVGAAALASGDSHAFKHTDATGLQDLGTLSGNYSTALVISANGLVVAGIGTLASGDTHAFRYTDADGMIDLGNLGGSDTAVRAISADGSVIAGYSKTTNDQAQHATIWRITESGLGPVPVIVDVDNTEQVMSKMANETQNILDMRSSWLQNLAAQDCQMGSGQLCVGTFAGYSDGSGNSQTDVGVTLGYQATKNVRLGTSFAYIVDSSMPDGYHETGYQNPSVAVFMQYQQPDALGFQGRMSAVVANNDVEITREKLGFTEAGKGQAKIKGQLYNIDAGYGLAVGESAITPYVGLQYREVARSGYTEETGAVFPMSYAQMGEQATSATVGTRVKVPLTEKLLLAADVGVSHDLNLNRDAFRAQADYLGSYHYGTDTESRTRLYAGVGVNYKVTPKDIVGLGVNWSEQSYGNDIGRVNLSYSHTF